MQRETRRLEEGTLVLVMGQSPEDHLRPSAVPLHLDGQLDQGPADPLAATLGPDDDDLELGRGEAHELVAVEGAAGQGRVELDRLQEEVRIRIAGGPELARPPRAVDLGGQRGEIGGLQPPGGDRSHGGPRCRR